MGTPNTGKMTNFYSRPVLYIPRALIRELPWSNHKQKPLNIIPGAGVSTDLTFLQLREFTLTGLFQLYFLL